MNWPADPRDNNSRIGRGMFGITAASAPLILESTKVFNQLAASAIGSFLNHQLGDGRRPYLWGQWFWTIFVVWISYRMLWTGDSDSRDAGMLIYMGLLGAVSMSILQRRLVPYPLEWRKRNASAIFIGSIFWCGVYLAFFAYFSMSVAEYPVVGFLVITFGAYLFPLFNYCMFIELVVPDEVTQEILAAEKRKPWRRRRSHPLVVIGMCLLISCIATIFSDDDTWSNLIAYPLQSVLELKDLYLFPMDMEY